MTDTPQKEQEQPQIVSAGEDDLRQYLQEIRQYPVLTPEQERALAIRCAQGDEEAAAQIVNSNLRLVVSVAREYAGRGVPLMDLIQEGNIGLLVAVKKFDYRLDYRFSTYATKWIRQGVTRCLLNHSSVIRVPVHTAEQIRRVNAIRNSFTQQHAREPELAELSKAADLPEDKVKELLELSPDVCSLDAPASDGDDASAIGQLVPDGSAAEPIERLAQEQMQHTLSGLLKQLPERQQEVLRLHYGLADGVCQSLEQIGKKLGISKERARQIERQALEKLQKLGDAQGLGDFLD